APDASPPWLGILEAVTSWPLTTTRAPKGSDTCAPVGSITATTQEPTALDVPFVMVNVARYPSPLLLSVVRVVESPCPASANDENTVPAAMMAPARHAATTTRIPTTLASPGGTPIDQYEQR